jgi:hypothetical protein
MEFEKLFTKKIHTDANGAKITVRDLYTTLNPQVNYEQFVSSGHAEAVTRMMEPIILEQDEHAPAAVAYWAKRGLVKEFHGENVPMDWDDYEKRTAYKYNREKYQLDEVDWKKWASFVPVSAFRPENKDRRYPLLFALHGGTNLVYTVDSWGYANAAAEKEWIVIVPSIELDEVILEILAEAERLYPVDMSRVYVTGFSYGGTMACRLAHQHPEVFAAAAPCGNLLGDGVFYWVGEEPEPPFDGVPRALEMGTYMPVISIYGDLELMRYPFYASAEVDSLIDGVNLWARVNHAGQLRKEDVMALSGREDISREEKKIGIPLAADCRRTIYADGVTFRIGDLKSADGVVRIRMICEENIPHCPTPEMARQVIDFCGHFSRNLLTKESIYTE